MKAKQWMVVTLVSASVVFAARGSLHRPDPDQKLAAHLAALCEVARGHVATPEQGVRQLGRYLGRHTGEMMDALGSTVMLIEQIDDDDAHDKRARVARRRLQEPLHACEDDWERFAEAVESDPEASELIAHSVERMSRTLEIIFSGIGSGTRSGAKLDVLHLPSQLAHAIDAIR
jgi:hypothetical protein